MQAQAVVSTGERNVSLPELILPRAGITPTR